MALCVAREHRKALKALTAAAPAEKSEAGDRWIKPLSLACLGLSILESSYLFWYIVFLSKRGWELLASYLVAASGMWVTYFLLRSYIAIRKRRQEISLGSYTGVKGG
jgi:hypothetical protein